MRKPVDLDSIEDAARTAEMLCERGCDPYVELPAAEVLALIARIRELEAEVDGLSDDPAGRALASGS